MMAYLRDDRYLRIPYEYDPTNRLTKLPKELFMIFMKIMYKACAGEEADYRHLLCCEIRKLPVCPKPGIDAAESSLSAGVESFNM